MISLTAPKPHDPRLPQFTAQDVSARFQAALSEPADDLQAETEMLDRAHAVLNEALQDKT